jgi:hypothetical protein
VDGPARRRRLVAFGTINNSNHEDARKGANNASSNLVKVCHPSMGFEDLIKA